ncbi:hypothetical protein [Pelagicoccus sp. SDUM812002]|uniref:hypothetical protein n=1 Tax=Pelagicoccus sp. SDUM812002 TaxID=3041266 RepID=UPI00280D6458|nr:hypothetical protein [Pelagicoccus sp. SDUM812002]MDQ8184275.1 hypothetical protein [Pelagicoccus sp. SDUM812002]
MRATPPPPGVLGGSSLVRLIRIRLLGTIARLLQAAPAYKSKAGAFPPPPEAARWPRALASFAPPAGVGAYAPPVRRFACSFAASRRAAEPPALKGHLSTVASQSGRIRSPLKVVLAKARLHLDRLALPPSRTLAAWQVAKFASTKTLR